MSIALHKYKRALPFVLLATGIVIGVSLHRGGIFAKARSVLFSREQRHPQTAPDSSQKCFTVLALGQSNAANFGKVRASGGPGAYAFCEGKFFACNDPLPGAGGEQGSVWSRVASRVLLDTEVKCSIVCALAQGSTTVRDWAPDRPLFQRAIVAARQLQEDGFPISAVVWHQGESDALLQTTTEQYRNHLQAIIQGLREQGINAPLFVCIASRNENGRVYEPVRLAQQSVVDAERAIYQGCDTDLLDDPFRWEGVHFNLRGLDAFAQGIVRCFGEIGLVNSGNAFGESPGQ